MIVDALLYHQHLKYITMKNLVSKIRLILSTLLVVVFYNFEPLEHMPEKGQASRENSLAHIINAAIAIPINQANKSYVLFDESSVNDI